MKTQRSELLPRKFANRESAKGATLAQAAAPARILAALLAAGFGLLGGIQATAQTLPTKIDNGQRPGLEIPVGTILPVKLDHSFSSKKAKSGRAITARVMQDVPLPGGEKIPSGAKIVGTVVSATSAGTGLGARMSLRFDQLEVHHRRIPIVTDLRALASAMEVENAETPETSPGFGTPYVWATTKQIGGDERYGYGSPVTDRSSRIVGEGVLGGVLVHVQAQPGTNCRGAMDADDRLQALWLFSADACGVYGIEGLRIEHAGRTEPVGEIVLAARSGEVKVGSGSGALLRVVR